MPDNEFFAPMSEVGPEFDPREPLMPRVTGIPPGRMASGGYDHAHIVEQANVTRPPQREVEVLTAERDAALLRVDQLEAEVDRLKVRLSEAGDRTDQAHAHADELMAVVSRVDQLEAEREHWKDRAGKLQSQCDSLGRRLAVRYEEKEKLRTELEELAVALEREHDFEKAHIAEITALKAQLAEEAERIDRWLEEAWQAMPDDVVLSADLAAAIATIVAERDKVRSVVAKVRERCQGWVDLPDWHAVTTYQVAGRSILDLLDGEQLALEVPERWRPLIDADVAEQVAERKAAEVDLLAEVCDRLADQLRDALTVVRFLRGEL